MIKKYSILKFYKIKILIFLIIYNFQISIYAHPENNFDHSNKDSIRYEDNNIEVTENLQLAKVNRIINNSFPAHYIIDGISHPVTSTYRGVLWPKERPDTLVIPEGIVNIGLYFTGSIYHRSRYPNLRCVKFPNSLKSIGPYAFNSNKLTNLIIPSSVIDIQSDAFADCKIENLDLGNVQFIGAQAFMNCGNLKWVRIPRETRLIGREAFNSYFSDNYRLFFLQLSPVDINPVVDFPNTFGSVDIPYVACASEFLNPGIGATYQSDMPEVFENRAMIHLESSPVPLYFSFEETGDREGVWEEGIDVWAYVDNPNADADAKSILAYPVRFRLDTSSLPHDRHARLRVLYNDREITVSIDNASFLIDSGRIFNGVDYKSGSEPIYNRLKVILE